MAPQRGEKASLGANCLRVAGSLKKRLQSLDEPRGRGVPAGAALLSNETQPGHALDRATPLWQKARGLRDAQATPARCRSSVVEHSLGKGEVESSILSGSTSNCSVFLLRTLRFPCRGIPRRARFNKRSLEFPAASPAARRAVRPADRWSPAGEAEFRAARAQGARAPAEESRAKDPGQVCRGGGRAHSPPVWRRQAISARIGS